MTDRSGRDFELSREHVDALRLDTQEHSPKERERLEALARDANDALLESWGKYIEKPHDSQEISARVLEMDDERANMFRGIWSGKEQDEFKGATFEASAYKVEGLIVLKDALPWAEAAWRDMPENMRDVMREEYAVTSDDGAVEKLREMREYALLAHEIAHIYQYEIARTYRSEGLYKFFGEMGALYYENQMLANRYPFVISQELDRSRNDFYRDLVERYDDEPHRVFFGAMHQKDAEKMLGEFTDEREKQFFSQLRS